MGCSSLNIDGVSKRIVYSESVNKMLQNGIDNETVMGCSSLNIDGISKRVVYSESVNKMLQHGIGKSNFSNGPILVLYILTKL